MKTVTKDINAIIDGEYCPLPIGIIPDRMGINLCGVDSVTWTQQDDNQLVSLTIHFSPHKSHEEVPYTQPEPGEWDYVQVETHASALLRNGVEIKPVATLASKGGAVAHIWVDDGCYQLGLEDYGGDGKGNMAKYVHPVTHIFREAFDVMSKLPPLPRK